jgi:type I restriction enzyme S subunit
MKTMNPDWLLSHFNEISEAPDAVPRLRRFVLDLAVRGKLVEQNPADEPASELLKRLRATRTQLTEPRKKRKENLLGNLKDAKCPFELPNTWEWIRLGEVSTLITKGSTPTSYGHVFVKSGINFVKIEAIKDGRISAGNITSYISKETHQFLKRSQLHNGDFLFSIAGSIGTCAVVTDSILPANINQALAIIRGVDAAFLVSFLQYATRSCLLELALAKAREGAMNNISLEDVRNFGLPLPPLAEQHRIVAKVDELMTLCDELEAAQQKRERRRDRLVAATLNGLNNGEGGSGTGERHEFEENAPSYFNHFPRLTTRPEHIQQLRQTILNLAVRGKLVPQDPNDESAEELLTRLESAKQHLIK